MYYSHVFVLFLSLTCCIVLSIHVLAISCVLFILHWIAWFYRTVLALGLFLFMLLFLYFIAKHFSYNPCMKVAIQSIIIIIITRPAAVAALQ